VMKTHLEQTKQVDDSPKPNETGRKTTEQKEVDRVRQLLARALEDLGMRDTWEASGWAGMYVYSRSHLAIC